MPTLVIGSFHLCGRITKLIFPPVFVQSPFALIEVITVVVAALGQSSCRTALDSSVEDARHWKT